MLVVALFPNPKVVTVFPANSCSKWCSQGAHRSKVVTSCAQLTYADIYVADKTQQHFIHRGVRDRGYYQKGRVDVCSIDWFNSYCERYHPTQTREHFV